MRYLERSSCRSRHSPSWRVPAAPSSSTSVNAPSSRCAVTATAQPAAVGAPGGSGSIVVTTDRECAWEARSEADWLVLSDAVRPRRRVAALHGGRQPGRQRAARRASSSTGCGSRSARRPRPAPSASTGPQQAVAAAGGRARRGDRGAGRLRLDGAQRRAVDRDRLRRGRPGLRRRLDRRGGRTRPLERAIAASSPSPGSPTSSSRRAPSSPARRRHRRRRPIRAARSPCRR